MFHTERLVVPEVVIIFWKTKIHSSKPHLLSVCRRLKCEYESWPNQFDVRMHLCYTFNGQVEVKTEWSDPYVYWRGGVCLYPYHFKTEWSNPEMQSCLCVGFWLVLFVSFLFHYVYNFQGEWADPDVYRSGDVCRYLYHFKTESLSIPLWDRVLIYTTLRPGGLIRRCSPTCLSVFCFLCLFACNFIMYIILRPSFLIQKWAGI